MYATRICVYGVIFCDLSAHFCFSHQNLNARRSPIAALNEETTERGFLFVGCWCSRCYCCCHLIRHYKYWIFLFNLYDSQLENGPIDKRKATWHTSVWKISLYIQSNTNISTINSNEKQGNHKWNKKSVIDIHEIKISIENFKYIPFSTFEFHLSLSVYMCF